MTARASPFASHGPRLAGDGAHGTGARAERQTRMIGGGHMDAERDAERDTDGTMDAHEGDHTPACFASMFVRQVRQCFSVV
ncbi:hypothetical protein DXC72_04265, partial [Bifidobacterium longum]